MRKLYLLSTLVLTLLLGSTASAQDFSNKGKDFYLCFPAHVQSSNLATLSIWITSDKASSGMVTMANGAFSAPFNIAANGIQEIRISHALGHISNGESTNSAATIRILKKSIRVKVDAGKPAVVAYAQQWAGARSAATLLLPVNVLGRKYYSYNFTQNSGAGGKSQFDIIAVNDNTVVQITPMANGVVGTPFSVTLPLAGDMIQYQPVSNSEDLTGTFIESVASASGGCMPIAVFSGSSNISMGTSSCNSFSSADPLFQQLYPISTWGKNFGFIPFANHPSGNPFRVMASEDNTNVYIDGALAATINKGQIYPAAFTSNPIVRTTPTSITADKPVSVAQYQQSNGCNGFGGTQGDPDMVILNPIEQNIKDITIFSTRQEVINTQWLNVLLKTNATASFMISRNGLPPAPPTSSWQPFPSLPGYSYLREQLPRPGDGSSTSPIGQTSDSYRLSADSGFNAIAYGLGTNESYAYSAGTNVKDLYQQIGVANPYSIEPTPTICKGSSFKFKVSLPYMADSIKWDLSLLPGPPAQPPTQIYSNPPVPADADSTTIVNGKTIYWYSLPNPYIFNVAGTFPVSITVYTSLVGDCGNEQTIDFELEVTEPPVVGFTVGPSGCVAEAIAFQDNTVSAKPTYKWWWEFGDPASGLLNNSDQKDPSHLFTGPGPFTIRYANITTAGCLSDTVEQTINIKAMPNATISSSATSACINATVQPQITFTGTDGATPYRFTYTINGGAPQTITTTGSNTSVSINVPTTTATSYTYQLTQINNDGSTLCVTNITGQTATVTINPDHTIVQSSPAATSDQTVCLNGAITPVTFTLGGGATGATVTGLPAGVTASVSGTTLTISGAPTTAVGTPFNYSIVTTGNTCVTANASGVIRVNPDHTLTLSSGVPSTAQSVCLNNAIIPITYQLGGGATGATVTGLPAGVSSSVSGNTLTISGAPTSAAGSPFNYSIVTTGNSCVTATANGTITIIPDHVITLTSGAATTSQAICVNTPITTITYALSGGATGALVTGLPAGVTSSVTGTTLTISGTPTAAGPFSYAVSTTGNACAAANANGTITVNPDHAITLTSGAPTAAQSVCLNGAITPITYNLSGGATGATVTGLPAGVTSSVSGTTLTISGAPTTAVGSPFNYSIVTTGNTCVTATANGSITLIPDHVITLSSGAATTSQTVCANTAITVITYTLSGGATGATVTGLPAGVTSSVTGTTLTISGSPTTASGTPYSYSITTTGNTCATATATGTITVNPVHTITLSSPAATANQAVCLNTAITAITYTLGGGATGATVTGLPAGVTSSVTGTTLTISGTPTTTAGSPFNYSITTTGNTCLTATATGTITVNALPVPDFTTSNPNCERRDITFTSTSTPGSGTLTKWNWDMGDGTILNLTSGAAFNHAYALPGTYQVKLQVETDKGCVATLTPPRSIVINARPKASFTPPVACTADAAPFDDESSVAAPNTITSWKWTFNDPNATAGNPNVVTAQNTTHQYTVLGNYTAELIATSAAGCSDTTTRTFFVNGSVTDADFTGDVPGGICSNQTVKLKDASTLEAGSKLIKLEIFWDYANDPTIKTVINNPVAGDEYTHTYPRFGTPASKTYTIHYVAYTGITCMRTETRNITLLAIPELRFDPILEVCADKPAFTITQASLLNVLPGGPGVYSGPGITAAGLFTPSSVIPGTHTLRYTYAATNGCTEYVERGITVNPVPIVDAGDNKVVLEGGQVTLTPVVTVGPLATYQWTPSLGLADPTIKNAVASPDDDRWYKLTVTSNKGCSASDQVFVKVLRKPVIPNIFSPNGDGIHDRWVIEHLESYPGCVVQIYNRYGGIVLRQVNYTTPWDGKVNGKDVPVGTYYYIIDPKNGRAPMTGFLDIVR